MLAKGLFSLIVGNLSSNHCHSLPGTTASETQFHFNMNRELFTQVLIKAIKAVSSLPFAMYTDSEARVTKPRIFGCSKDRRASRLPVHLTVYAFIPSAPFVCFIKTQPPLSLCSAVFSSVRWNNNSTYLIGFMGNI